MPTPREQAMKLGAASGISGSDPKTPDADPQRQKDSVLTQSQKERLLLDVKPPKPAPKPFR